jgi:anaphase-promoting complex subunit 11
MTRTAVAKWTWNAGDLGDVCSICQNAYEATAPGIKYPGEDCPVVFGKCKHAFHLQCVSQWLNQVNAKNSCPICRQDWEFGSNTTTAITSTNVAAAAATTNNATVNDSENMDDS